MGIIFTIMLNIINDPDYMISLTVDIDRLYPGHTDNL